MQYHEHQINEPLTEYIQTVWAMESKNDEDIYPRSLIMPDGIVEIIFHYETPFYTWQDGKKFLQPENFAVSMMQQYTEIASSGKAGFISVRFFPWGAYHFFDEPVQNFLDRTINATKLWGNDSGKIIKEMKTLNSFEERFKAVEQFLLEKLKQHKKEEAEADNAIKLIRQTKGALTIEKVCAETGLSKKQLERKFLATVGIMPKAFSRITRFLNICQNLDEQKNKTLTQITYECGFYDQAHFIKEFKAFSGFTPKEFFEKENVYFSEI
ncbi:MAG: AraC family transcriptional regulator [Flavobacteriales bacterium]|jgi:AraC-like DNA-binding protein|nr:AraC family transcriptional regulator [Flavobacteriales bacterium]